MGEGDEEMAQLFRVLSAAAEDPDLVASIHRVDHNHLFLQSWESGTLFWCSQAPHTHIVHICADKHSHTEDKSKFKSNIHHQESYNLWGMRTTLSHELTSAAHTLS